MRDSALSVVPVEFSQNRLLQWMLALYSVLWLVMAVSPIDRLDWALENVLAVAFLGLLITTHRSFVFTNRSYVLMGLFMGLHAIGAHYTYGQVPAGYWLKDHLELVRNPFDRIAHFSFGLLMAYPARELCLRSLKVSRFWSWYLPVDAILALSAAYELLEASVAQTVTPDLAEKYLGLQGDPWDSQKDMTCALVGAVVAMVVTALLERRRAARWRPA